MPENRQIVLASRPQGEPSADNFRLVRQPALRPEAGQVLLRTLYLSLDPYMRMRMNDQKSYAKPAQIGEPMVGGTVSEVVESLHEGFAPGEIVLAGAGWQDYAVSDGTGLRKLRAAGEARDAPGRPPLSTALGVLGMPGMTAYTGLLTIGQPRPGETVVVAAATGPVGSAVGQIAAIKGARTVGIAGGPEKCRALREEFGFDAALDHRDPDLPAQLAQACPDGIDVYFENVGGRVWEAVFPLLNDFSRIPVCGLVSQYSDAAAPAGPDRLPGLMRAILTRRLTLRGFIVTDFADQRDAFLRDMGEWVGSGKVRYREDVTQGLEKAPEAFIGMLKGRNFGKVVVDVAGQAA
jgi:NADPH-dependent curcumin reductase CurA